MWQRQCYWWAGYNIHFRWRCRQRPQVVMLRGLGTFHAINCRTGRCRVCLGYALTSQLYPLWAHGGPVVTDNWVSMNKLVSTV